MLVTNEGHLAKKSARTTKSSVNIPHGKNPEVLERNVQTIAKLKKEHHDSRGRLTAASEYIGSFFGSVHAIYLHILLLTVWIAINIRMMPGVSPFDPPPFQYLSLSACLEAIMLSMFVLIRQNRTMVASEKRAELALQMGLLTESELTRLTRLNILIAHKLEIDAEAEIEDLAEMSEETDPVNVIRSLEEANDNER